MSNNNLKRKLLDVMYAPLRMVNYKPENAISLFCAPRGGSTWLCEIFNKMDRTLSEINKPSSSNAESIQVIDPITILHKWKKQLMPQQQKRMFKVLEYFKVDCYDNVMPTSNQYIT